jgi:alcohol dehydrogenase class IV
MTNSLFERNTMSLLEDVLTTLKHARTFIGTREKMHHDGQKLYDEAIDALQAAMTTHVLVPREPTEGMLTVGRSAMQKNGAEGSDDAIYADAKCCWDSMLSAAEKEK